jgi:hypothetical protein
LHRALVEGGGSQLIFGDANPEISPAVGLIVIGTRAVFSLKALPRSYVFFLLFLLFIIEIVVSWLMYFCEPVTILAMFLETHTSLSSHL